MNQNEFKDFLNEQRKEMLCHKWIESEKAHHDLGQEAIIHWIKLYAKQFRQQYESNNHLDVT